MEDQCHSTVDLGAVEIGGVTEATSQLIDKVKGLKKDVLSVNLLEGRSRKSARKDCLNRPKNGALRVRLLNIDEKCAAAGQVAP